MQTNKFHDVSAFSSAVAAVYTTLQPSAASVSAAFNLMRRHQPSAASVSPVDLIESSSGATAIVGGSPAT